jgi:hypothetical protein
MLLFVLRAASAELYAPRPNAVQPRGDAMLGVTMASYYTSQAYDAPPQLIWTILTDFPAWPRWFPNMSSLRLEDEHAAGPGATLMALTDDGRNWARWRIIDWKDAELLLCEFHGTNAGLSAQIQNAYLQFALLNEPEGCTLEVEIGAEGSGIVGDFFVGTSLGMGARRMLPRLMDAFTDHVIERVSSMP